MITEGRASQLTRVRVGAHELHGQVLHTWQLPDVGVTAIADDTGATPEQLAHSAGWTELASGGDVSVAYDDIRSLRIRGGEKGDGGGHLILILAGIALLVGAAVALKAACGKCE